MNDRKTYSEYTQEELSKLDDLTIADLIHEEQKLYGKTPSLEDNLRVYENKKHIMS